MSSVVVAQVATYICGFGAGLRVNICDLASARYCSQVLVNYARALAVTSIISPFGVTSGGRERYAMVWVLVCVVCSNCYLLVV